MHNLNRELQTPTGETGRSTSGERAPWWCLARLGIFRMRLIQRAGRPTNPKGRLTIPVSANPAVQAEL